LQVQFAGNVPQFRSSAPLGQSFLPSHRRAKGTHEPSRQVKSDAGQGATKPPTPRRHRHVYTLTLSHTQSIYIYIYIQQTLDYSTLSTSLMFNVVVKLMLLLYVTLFKNKYVYTK